MACSARCEEVALTHPQTPSTNIDKAMFSGPFFRIHPASRQLTSWSSAVPSHCHCQYGTVTTVSRWCRDTISAVGASNVNTAADCPEPHVQLPICQHRSSLMMLQHHPQSWWWTTEQTPQTSRGSGVTYWGSLMTLCQAQQPPAFHQPSKMQPGTSSAVFVLVSIDVLLH